MILILKLVRAPAIPCTFGCPNINITNIILIQQPDRVAGARRAVDRIHVTRSESHAIMILSPHPLMSLPSDDRWQTCECGNS